MNTSAKGRAREHKTMKVLRADGWQCARAAASKGEGGIDIIAWNYRDIRFIQVKSGKAIKNSAADRILSRIRKALNAPNNAWIELWNWEDYAKSPKVWL